MSKACDPGTHRVSVTFDPPFIYGKVIYFAFAKIDFYAVYQEEIHHNFLSVRNLDIIFLKTKSTYVSVPLYLFSK